MHLDNIVGNFRKDIFILEARDLEKSLIQKTSRGLVPVSEPVFIGMIKKYLGGIVSSPKSDFSYFSKLYTEAHMREVIFEWVSRSELKVIKESNILPVTFKGDSRLSWAILPFAYDVPVDVDTECPTWCEILSRASNYQAVIDFMGSLIVPDSGKQQYLWLHGGGGDSKSSLTGALCRALGSVATSLRCERDRVDQWFEGNVFGKRLVIFPDTKNASFPVSGLFKTLTGGDMVTANRKYERQFRFDPIAKYIFTSNVKPNIGGARAEVRRCIYSYIEKIDKLEMPENEFNDLLDSEMPKFLSYCVSSYCENYPNRAAIVTDKDVTAQLISGNEEWMETMVERYLNINPEGEATLSDMQRFWEMCKIGSPRHKYERDQFIEYLNRHLGVTRCQLRKGEKRVKLYKGCTVKDVPFS